MHTKGPSAYLITIEKNLAPLLECAPNFQQTTMYKACLNIKEKIIPDEIVEWNTHMPFTMRALMHCILKNKANEFPEENAPLPMKECMVCCLRICARVLANGRRIRRLPTPSWPRSAISRRVRPSPTTLTAPLATLASANSVHTRPRGPSCYLLLSELIARRLASRYLLFDTFLDMYTTTGVHLEQGCKWGKTSLYLMQRGNQIV